MPTYDYHCEECGHSFSTVESMEEHDRAEPTCPECNSTHVKRVFAQFFAKTGKKS